MTRINHSNTSKDPEFLLLNARFRPEVDYSAAVGRNHDQVVLQKISVIGLTGVGFFSCSAGLMVDGFHTHPLCNSRRPIGLDMSSMEEFFCGSFLIIVL
jgi:hypothetical protein